MLCHLCRFLYLGFFPCTCKLMYHIQIYIHTFYTYMIWALQWPSLTSLEMVVQQGIPSKVPQFIIQPSEFLYTVYIYIFIHRYIRPPRKPMFWHCNEGRQDRISLSINFLLAWVVLVMLFCFSLCTWMILLSINLCIVHNYSKFLWILWQETYPHLNSHSW